jgi:adenosylmethionine-8-amino-7-oxononanoate aminotransferase
MLGSTTNPQIESLTNQLSLLVNGLSKVFYAGGDGSSAVEVALKLSLHSRRLNKQSHKTKFISLSNGYHGDTSGAMSVSNNKTINNDSYKSMLFDCYNIQNIPYVTGIQDPKWSNCEDEWLLIETELKKMSQFTNAIILEPIVQGAGNMKIYSKDFLQRLAKWAQDNDIYLIADEIMTGIGRTGKMFAFQHADIIPDFVCIGKGITSGSLPLSMVLVNDKVYGTFHNGDHQDEAFLHSHTYAGNTLGATVASTTLSIIKEHNILTYVNTVLNPYLLNSFENVSKKTGMISNIRSIGAIVAGEVDTKNIHDFSTRFASQAGKLGALLRPLGNTIYWLPPLNTNLDTISELEKITCSTLYKL